MSDNSRIEWTDATWNFIVGCTKVSAGCDNCYAERDVNRWNGQGAFDALVVKPEKLDLPLRWRRPRLVFVNSLSDLFHEKVPVEIIARAFAVMAWAHQHTFQILTKRHGRLRSLLNDPAFLDAVEREWCNVQDWTDARLTDPEHFDTMPRPGYWPLPNVWLGVSVEDQRWADIRIPALLDTPAAVRFLSCEPLLGQVDLHRLYNVSPTSDLSVFPLGHVARGIHWVIAGGESGPKARPMHPTWARQLRDQCADAGVAFHFKQWGQFDAAGRRCRSKHDAGRELDGRTHDEMPLTAALTESA